MASRLESQPTTARRGVPSEEGATSAWISTSSGRVPSMPANTQAPETWPRRSPEEQGRGVGDLRQAAVGHLEHADLVGRAEAVLDGAQDAELVAALALEVEHGVDHVLEHARAGDGAVLGDVADQQDGDAAALGERDQRLRRGAHLGDRAGRAVDRVEPHGLDRIDHRERLGASGRSSVATMSRTEVAAASCTGASARPSRSARRRTWSSASSPEM